MTLGNLRISAFYCIFTKKNYEFRIRGALGSIAPFVRSTAYMVAIIVGTNVEYSIVPFLYIGLPVVFFAIFLCLPNTAPYLIRAGAYEVSFNNRKSLN